MCIYNHTCYNWHLSICFFCTIVAAVTGIVNPLFQCYQPVLSELLKHCNTCQKRCMLSPSPSSTTALYILDPLSALSFLPQYAPRLGTFFFFPDQTSARQRRFDPSHVIQSFWVPEICTWYKQGFTSHATVNQIKLSCRFYPFGSSGNLDSCTLRPQNSTALTGQSCLFNVPMKPCANWMYLSRWFLFRVGWEGLVPSKNRFFVQFDVDVSRLSEYLNVFGQGSVHVRIHIPIIFKTINSIWRFLCQKGIGTGFLPCLK